MAELIPLSYRIRVATRQRLERWSFVGVLVVVGCVGATLVSYGWHQFGSLQMTELQQHYRDRSALIARSQELRAKRQELADRMQKIQHLMDDRTVLALLNSTAQAFSDEDCLESVEIDGPNAPNYDTALPIPGASAAARPGARRGPEQHPVVVLISGITTDAASLSRLMMRLGQQTEPQVAVTLEYSKREQFLDGSVMRFQLRCRSNAAAG